MQMRRWVLVSVVLAGCGGDDLGALDAGPDAVTDVTRPRLLATTPADGTTGLAHRELTSLQLRFDEPIDLARGVVRLRAGATSTALTAGAIDPSTVALDVTGLLDPGQVYSVELDGWADRAGNLADLTPGIADGQLDFATAPPAEPVAPRLIAARPAPDAVDVYPAEVFDGTSQRVRVVLTFDEPMDPARATLSWGPAGDPGAALIGAWSDDGLTLTADIVAPILTGQRPVADRTTYAVDLGGLRDLSGNRVEPPRQLRFTTGSYDALLNHSCGHVFFGPFTTVVAASAPASTIVRADTPHTRYTVELPGPLHAGYARFRAPTRATVYLFLDGDLPLIVERADGSAVASTRAATPRACGGISDVLVFHTEPGDQFSMVLGPHDQPELRFIVEAVAE